MGNAQAIAAFLRTTQRIDLSKINNLENAISRIVESGAAYEHEQDLKTFIDVLFAERDAIVNDMVESSITRITKEVMEAVVLQKTANADPVLVLRGESSAAAADITTANTTTTANSFADLFAT